MRKKHTLKLHMMKTHNCDIKRTSLDTPPLMFPENKQEIIIHLKTMAGKMSSVQKSHRLLKAKPVTEIMRQQML